MTNDAQNALRRGWYALCALSITIVSFLLHMHAVNAISVCMTSNGEISSNFHADIPL